MARTITLRRIDDARLSAFVDAYRKLSLHLVDERTVVWTQKQAEKIFRGLLPLYESVNGRLEQKLASSIDSLMNGTLYEEVTGPGMDQETKDFTFRWNFAFLIQRLGFVFLDERSDQSTAAKIELEGGIESAWDVIDALTFGIPVTVPEVRALDPKLWGMKAHVALGPITYVSSPHIVSFRGPKAVAQLTAGQKRSIPFDETLPFLRAHGFTVEPFLMELLEKYHATATEIFPKLRSFLDETSRSGLAFVSTFDDTTDYE